MNGATNGALTPLEVAKVYKFLGYPLTTGNMPAEMGSQVLGQPQSMIPVACANLMPFASAIIREYIERLECIEKQQQMAYMNQQVVVAGKTTMSGPLAIQALYIAYQHEQAKLSDALNVPVYIHASYTAPGSPSVHEPH